MDRLDNYRRIIREILQDYGSIKQSYGDVRSEVIIDPVSDHYELMHVGWQGPRRVHGSVVHLDIIDGKIWIQHDGTNRPVADELLAAGVPREHIVLGFHPASVRKHTAFAEG